MSDIDSGATLQGRIRGVLAVATLTVIGAVAAVAPPAAVSTPEPVTALHSFGGTTTTTQPALGVDTPPGTLAPAVSTERCPAESGHALPVSVSRICGDHPNLEGQG